MGRKAYWMTIVALTVLPVLINFVFPKVSAANIVLFWMSVATVSRRLHDSGRSGWLNLIWIGVQVGCVAALFLTGSWRSVLLPDEHATNDFQAIEGLLLLLLALMAQLAFLVWAGVLKPDPHENRFGPTPGRPPVEQTFS